MTVETVVVCDGLLDEDGDDIGCPHSARVHGTRGEAQALDGFDLVDGRDLCADCKAQFAQRQVQIDSCVAISHVE